MQLKRMSTSILSNGTPKMSEYCVVSLGIRNKVMHGHLIQASLYIHTYGTNQNKVPVPYS